MTKKILQICPYPFNHIGGVEKYSEILQEILTNNSENIDFQTACGGKDFEILEIVKNCPLPRFWTKDFWNFIKNIKKNPPKIIISHIRFAPTAWFAFWLSKCINAKYIHIEHGTGFLVHNNFLIRNTAKIVDLTIGKYILKNADFVVTISKAGENWVKNFAGRTKNIETIYRGFEIMKNKEGGIKNFGKNFTKIEKNLQKSEGKTFVIGFVGRLVSLKNLNSLLVALSKITVKNWALEIIGDGEMASEWEKLAKNLGIAEKIIWHGKKENSWILENFYPNIDIFVNPSLQEGLPTTVVEAKIAGCQVLATDVGGTSEIPDIILCEPTTQSLQKHLEIMLKNPEKHPSSKAFQEKFSKHNMKKQYLDMFKKNL